MESTKDANKLIAEFMGYEYIGWNDENHRSPDCTSGYWGLKGAKYHGLKLPKTMMFNPLQYHDSWDLLIPVVQKCYKIESQRRKSGMTWNPIDGYCSHLSSMKIQSSQLKDVFNEVLIFIRAYNQKYK